MNTIRTSRLHPRITSFLVVIAIMLLAGSIAEACPTCKVALENSTAGGNLIRGYFWSIMFMMATPFAILGGFSGYMYNEVRKARRKREAEEADSTQSDP